MMMKKRFMGYDAVLVVFDKNRDYNAEKQTSLLLAGEESVRVGTAIIAILRAGTAIPYGIALNNTELQTHHRRIPLGSRR